MHVPYADTAHFNLKERGKKYMLRKTTRATITTDVSLEPYTTLRRGETGTVVFEDQFGIDVQMDKSHDGLVWWDNVAHIAAEERDLVNVTQRCALTPRGSIILVLLSGAALVVVLELIYKGLAV